MIAAAAAAMMLAALQGAASPSNEMRSPASTPAQAQPSLDEARTRTELEAFRLELNAAIQNKDRAAMERLYAPEFQYMHGFGNHDDRNEQIASIMDPAVTLRELPPVFGPGDTLILEGNVAIVRQRRSNAGQRLFGTVIYVKRGGAWQLLQIQGTAIAPERIAIDVPAAILRSYVGRYAQSNGNVADFTLDGGQLFVQFPGRPRWRLTPVEQDIFFDPSDNRYRFERRAEQVTGYSLRTPYGVEITGAREGVPPQR